MIDLVLTSGGFALIALALFCTGDLLLWRLFKNDSDIPAGRTATASALGLLVFAAVSYILGIAGFLHRLPLLLALLFPVGLAILAGRFQWKVRFGRPSVTGVCFFAICSLLFLAAQSPLIGNDALCYHFYLAKEFAANHRIASLPTHENSDWPFLFESLYAAGLVLKGEGFAKLFHFYAALLTAFSLFAYSKRRVAGVTPFFAPLAFLLSPLVANLAGMAYIDLGLAAFGWFALAAVLRWSESGRLGWVVLGGIFCGAALGVKFLAGFTMAGIFVLIALAPLPLLRRVQAGLCFAGVSAVFCGYWYIKLAVIYGNPVHPYFAGFFGGAGDALSHHHNAIPKNIFGYLAAPFFITFRPQALSGFAEQPGPIFLMFGIFAGAGARPLWRSLSIFSLIYLFLWISLYQNLRFLAPLLPALAILASMGLAVLLKKGGVVRRATIFMAWAVLGTQALMLLYHYRSEWPAVLKASERERYLVQKERSYATAQHMNAQYGRKAKIFMPNEILFYPFDQTVMRGNVLIARHPDDYATLKRGAASLENEKVTHVLILPDEPMPPFAEQLCLADPDTLADAGFAEEVVPDARYRLFRVLGSDL